MGLPPDPLPITAFGQARRSLVETLDSWAALWFEDLRGEAFLLLAAERLATVVRSLCHDLADVAAPALS